MHSPPRIQKYLDKSASAVFTSEVESSSSALSSLDEMNGLTSDACTRSKRLRMMANESCDEDDDSSRSPVSLTSLSSRISTLPSMSNEQGEDQLQDKKECYYGRYDTDRIGRNMEYKLQNNSDLLNDDRDNEKWTMVNGEHSLYKENESNPIDSVQGYSTKVESMNEYEAASTSTTKGALHDVVAFIDARTSTGVSMHEKISQQLKNLGARISLDLDNTVTHIILANARPNTRRCLSQLMRNHYENNIKEQPVIIGPSWCDACMELKDISVKESHLLNMAHSVGISNHHHHHQFAEVNTRPDLDRFPILSIHRPRKTSPLALSCVSAISDDETCDESDEHDLCDHESELSHNPTSVASDTDSDKDADRAPDTSKWIRCRIEEYNLPEESPMSFTDFNLAESVFSDTYILNFNSASSCISDQTSLQPNCLITENVLFQDDNSGTAISSDQLGLDIPVSQQPDTNI